MNYWIAFWNILLKDMRTYYLKPPNVSWGLVFPLAWTAMFFIRSGSGLGSIPVLLPGVVAVSILFGTTSMLAVTVTFEKKNRSFERLLLEPVSYLLPLTYGVDVLHGTVHGAHMLPFSLDLGILGLFCVGLFMISLWNIKRKWIL